MPKVSQIMAKNGCFDQEVVFKHEVSSINRDGSTGVSPSVSMKESLNIYADLEIVFSDC